MTEERKQELRQLLEEAMQSIVIEVPEGYEPISVEKYREDAKAFRESYRPDLSFILEYSPNIQDDAMKSKLFNFMKGELVDYICEDGSACPPTHWIQPAKRAIRGYRKLIPVPLDRLLEKLLEIVIVSGTEQAILALDRCTRDTIGAFQKIILLQGLYVRYSDATKEALDTHIAEGIRFVQLPSYNVGQISDLYQSEQFGAVQLPSYIEGLPPYLFNESFLSNLSHEIFISMVGDTPSWSKQRSKFPLALHLSIFSGAPLLIIDYTVSPLFCKPSLKEELDESDQFEISIESAEFPNFDVHKFCQALSLIANYAVESLSKWQYISEGELFNIESWFPKEMGNLAMPDPLSGTGVIYETDIDKARCLYKLLTDPSSNIGEKLQIPIDRWIKSKTEDNPVDKIIDLGIALESLYLSGAESKNEIRFRFSLHAAWHLGKDKKQREALMKEFKAIYDWRSAVVHTGKLPKKGSGKKKKSYTQEEVREFIRNAQDLCRDSIIKILEDGAFPDWNTLILG